MRRGPRYSITKTVRQPIWGPKREDVSIDILECIPYARRVDWVQNVPRSLT